jgi:hypothetical protein
MGLAAAHSGAAADSVRAVRQLREGRAGRGAGGSAALSRRRRWWHAVDPNQTTRRSAATRRRAAASAAPRRPGPVSRSRRCVNPGVKLIAACPPAALPPRRAGAQRAAAHHSRADLLVRVLVGVHDRIQHVGQQRQERRILRHLRRGVLRGGALDVRQGRAGTLLPVRHSPQRAPPGRPPASPGAPRWTRQQHLTPSQTGGRAPAPQSCRPPFRPTDQRAPGAHSKSPGGVGLGERLPRALAPTTHTGPQRAAWAASLESHV